MIISYPAGVTKPARVTAELLRSDAIYASPITGVQQVASRGNAFWKWTIEYRDISESERDIVQAFLMNCRGSLNPFKVPDFGNYVTGGVASAWTDIFSNAGDLIDQADYDFFTHSAKVNKTILSAGGVRNEIRDDSATLNMYAQSVNSISAGNTYVVRAKFHNADTIMSARFAVGSQYDFLTTGLIQSGGQISAPFYAHVGSVEFISIFNSAESNYIGDSWEFTQFRCARAAMVSNSENLLTYSNDFENAAWSPTNANVASGYGDSPTGITSGSWKAFGNADTNTTHIIHQSFTKILSESMFNFSLYARKVEIERLRIRIDDGTATNKRHADFHLNSGTITAQTTDGDFVKGHSKIFDVGSDWYKLNVSAVTNSGPTIRAFIYLLDNTGAEQYTNNGSDGVEIFGAQLRQHPYAGQYVPTVASNVVGSGWQTGSKLYVEGLDADSVIATAGARFEIINRYYDVSSHYERSEFKRLTADLIANREGWGVMEFDPPIRNAPQYQHAGPVAGTNFEGEKMHPVVVFDRPEMRGRLVGSTVQYIEKPLQLTDVVFEVIEDLADE